MHLAELNIGRQPAPRMPRVWLNSWRRQQWFEALDQMHFVMWRALERLEHQRINGDSAPAFGWKWRAEAKLYQTRSCTRTAAD